MEKSEEDPFLQLPDEVLIFIFSKVRDFRYLSQCSVVSKRFSSAILLVPTVSSAIPTKRSSFNLQLASLKRFHGIRSLELEFPSNWSGGDDGVLLHSWKVSSHRIGTTKHESFALLSFRRSVEQVEGENGKAEEDVATILSRDEQERLVQMAVKCSSHVATCCRFLVGVIGLVPPTIVSVTITDARKLGMFRIGGKRLVELRNEYRDKESAELESWSENSTLLEHPIEWIDRIKVGYVPVLCLPGLGCDLKRVSLVILGMEGSSSSEDDDDDYTDSDYEDDESYDEDDDDSNSEDYTDSNDDEVTELDFGDIAKLFNLDDGDDVVGGGGTASGAGDDTDDDYDNNNNNDGDCVGGGDNDVDGVGGGDNDVDDVGAIGSGGSSDSDSDSDAEDDYDDNDNDNDNDDDDDGGVDDEDGDEGNGNDGKEEDKVEDDSDDEDYASGDEDGDDVDDDDDNDNDDDDDSDDELMGWDFHDYDEIMEWDFGEDEKVFSWEFEADEEVFKEAATLILTDHKDKIRSFK